MRLKVKSKDVIFDMSNDYCLLFLTGWIVTIILGGGAKVKMSQNSPFLHNMISNERVESNYRFAITACSHKKMLHLQNLTNFSKRKLYWMTMNYLYEYYKLFVWNANVVVWKIISYLCEKLMCLCKSVCLFFQLESSI